MRERNGWYDEGKPILGSTNKCPNCGQHTYKETVSREHCTSCGMECDYWGGGTNKVYEQYARDYQEKMDKAQRESYNRKYGYQPGDDYYRDES